MSYFLRIAALVGLITGIFLIVSSFEEKSSILVENTQGKGVLFMDGLYQSGNSFCFTPESSTNYNLALVGDNSRQNIQVSKSNEVSIGQSEGENLGMKVSKVSQKTLENDPKCQ